jgi:hypothetical protein
MFCNDMVFFKCKNMTFLRRQSEILISNELHLAIWSPLLLMADVSRFTSGRMINGSGNKYRAKKHARHFMRHSLLKAGFMRARTHTCLRKLRRAAAHAPSYMFVCSIKKLNPAAATD